MSRLSKFAHSPSVNQDISALMGLGLTRSDSEALIVRAHTEYSAGQTTQLLLVADILDAFLAQAIEDGFVDLAVEPNLDELDGDYGEGDNMSEPEYDRQASAPRTV